MRIPPPDTLRPGQYADAAVTEYVRQLVIEADRIKNHRVANTFPRDPPTWSQTLIDAAKVEPTDEPPTETPMWNLEFIDSPWADAQTQFKAVAAHDQEWRREVKGARLELEAKWKEEKEAPPMTAGLGPAAVAIPPTPGAAPATPGPTTPATPAAATPSDPLVAPGSTTATGKKKPTTKPPTLSKAAQQANARKLEEQRSAQQMTQELTRSMGRKRKAWMLGGGPGAGASPATPGPKTPAVDFKKRRKLDGMEVDGSPGARTPGSPSPASPSPLGQRAPGFTAVPSGLNPHAKRVKSVAPEEPVEPVKSESDKTPTPAPEEATPSTVYQFPEVPDRLTNLDVKTAYERRLRRGGSFRRVLENRYEHLLLDFAKKEAAAWTASHAGGLAAAAAAQAKKDVKPAGLLTMTRKSAGMLPTTGGSR